MIRNLNDIISGVDEVLNSAKHGNFEEVLNKTKSYAEDAAKKSAERLEISKKKIELLDSKTKLVKAYENFGKLQFEAYEGKSVSQDEFDACIEEITLQKNRADLLDKEIEELKIVFSEPLTKREAKQAERKVRRDAKASKGSSDDNDGDIEVTVVDGEIE